MGLRRSGATDTIGSYCGALFRGLFIALCVVFVSNPVRAAEPMTLPELMKAFTWDFAAPVRAEKVTDGFYVLFGVGGNVAVSIGAQGTLIVDDQFPEMMPKLQQAIEKLGGKAVDFAINTHWHFDHAQGNLALGPEGTWLVSHELSRQMMQEDHNINLVILNYEQQAYPLEAQPVITYHDRMQFHFNGQQVDLLHFGPAHTTGDTAVYFRNSNAIHLGDVFNRSYPFIDVDNGGSLPGTIAFCKAVLAVINDDTHVIPGHGDISDREGLVRYIQMMEKVSDNISAMVMAGYSLEQVVSSVPTAEFDAEFGDPTIFVNRAYTSLKQDFDATRSIQ